MNTMARQKRWLPCSNDTLNGTTPVMSQTKHDINVETCESNTIIITSLHFISSVSSPWKNFQLIRGATVSTRPKSHTCTQLHDYYYVDGEKLGNVLAETDYGHRQALFCAGSQSSDRTPNSSTHRDAYEHFAWASGCCAEGAVLSGLHFLPQRWLVAHLKMVGRVPWQQVNRPQDTSNSLFGFE